MATETPTQTYGSEETLSDRIFKGLREIRNNGHALIGLIILTPIILAIVFAPVLAPYNPTETHAVDRLEGPSEEYPLGTDHLGRDLLSRVLFGGRSSLTLGLAATGLATVVGVPIGIISGYAGGRTDEFIMRIMDSLLSFPSLLLALLIVAMLGSSLVNAIAAIAIVYTPRLARISRSSTLSIKQEEFITAARARGESRMNMWFNEILPNAIYPVIVEGSIRVGFAILIGTSLSFLGLGTQPPTADWGYMISVARTHIWSSIWFWLWPSLALGTTIVGFNLLGDGLRDILDPQVEGSEGL